MKRLMMDMDDVIVKGGLLYLINEYTGKNYVEEDFKDFYMQNIVPNKKDFFEFFLSRNMYDHCELAPYAYEVLEELNKELKLYIGTSYVFREIIGESGIILKQKYEYLLKTFPFLKPENLVFLVDKSVLNCEIRVDDLIRNLEGAETKILFTAFHNREIENAFLKEQGIERADDLLEVRRIVLKR